MFISTLFSSDGRFRYSFERNGRWAYDDLYAPFDFPIKKSEAEIKAELAELEAEFTPYYSLDPNMVKRREAAFESTFEEQREMLASNPGFKDVRDNPGPYLRYGKRFLSKIYDQGLLKLESEEGAVTDDFIINLVQGNTTQRRKAADFLQLPQAIELLNKELASSALPNSDFLLPILQDQLQPNITYDAALTARSRDELLSTVPSYRDKIKAGDLIIKQGAEINEANYQKLVSFREAYQKDISSQRSFWNVFLGYFILTGLIIGVFVGFLRRFKPDIFSSWNKLLFIFLWIIAYSYLVSLVERTNILSAYLIPFSIVPIVIKTFYDGRLALFTHIVVVLLASFLSSLGYEFTFMQILVGIVVLLRDVDTRDWNRFFYSMLYIFMAYALAYFGLSLIKTGRMGEIDWWVYTWIFLNVFLTLLAYPLVPLLERIFGFVSAFTLVELSDLNRPLLQRLAIEAPGTLQHSLQVANLSEAAARRIGADHLLVKVAALYHDIGKTKRPEFFIENQGDENPHNGKNELDSAKIIVGHVLEGYSMAKKHRLPQVLIDFILTHHGTTRVEYFYRKYAEKQEEGSFDESLFRYPGPTPRTKEESILMMADSIEAACKSLKEPTGKAVDDLVERIIAGKITQGQLEQSTLTFEELELCKEIFKKTMRSVHHIRVEYPKGERPGNGTSDNDSSANATATPPADSPAKDVP